MTLRWVCCSLLAMTQMISAQSKPEQAPLLGYSPEGSSLQRDWETKFRNGVVPGNIRENMRRLSARPHHVGSPYDKENAEWILSKFKEWGFDAKIETFDALFPTPKVRVLEMLQPTPFRAVLTEPAVSADATSRQ